MIRIFLLFILISSDASAFHIAHGKDYTDKEKIEVSPIMQKINELIPLPHYLKIEEINRNSLRIKLNFKF